MIDREGPEWARTAFWLLTAAYAAVLLTALAFFGVGLALGPPADGPPPEVDFDAPPREVIDDATARLRHRNYAATYSLEYRNRTSGNDSGGTFARLRFENSRDRYRGTVAIWWLVGQPEFRPGESVDVWSGGYGVGFGRAPGEPAWQRVVLEDLRLPGQPQPIEGSLSERASLEVTADNDTHYVATATDPDRLERSTDVTYTVRVVVAKRPDPHLAGFTVRDVDDERTTAVDVAVSDYRTATAPRPKRVPSVTIEELVGQSIDGLQRLR